MSKKNQGLFWASYTDLMTSLFFIMLVLYMLTFRLLQNEKNRLKADAEKYQKIVKVEEAVKNLENGKQFKYDENFKRLLLTRKIQFAVSSADIHPRYNSYLKTIGKKIHTLITKKEKKVRYLVIIEGMASQSGATDNNYALSYKRAYALFKFWKEAGINLESNENEILIAGSGTGGVGRDNTDKNNQRFLIQIIPKIDAK